MRKLYSFLLSLFLAKIASSIYIDYVMPETDPELPNFDITRHKNWHRLENDNCGLSLSNRIIGGKDATLGQYPWIARIGYTKEFNKTEYYHSHSAEDEYNGNQTTLAFECGGALVSSNYIVTAAHCTTGLPSDTKLSLIRLGEHNDLTDIDCDEYDFCAEPVQDFLPKRIIPHPEYAPELYKHDLALIELDRPVSDNGWVSPICSMSGELLKKDFIGEYAEVAGWGYIDEDDEMLAHVLQTVQLPIVDNSICSHGYRRVTSIGISQLCVGGIIGMDSCGGDSGGPLQKVESVNDQSPRYYLIGLVSFGTRYCGESKIPAVYTRLANYMLWILDNMQ